LGGRSREAILPAICKVMKSCPGRLDSTSRVDVMFPPFGMWAVAQARGDRSSGAGFVLFLLIQYRFYIRFFLAPTV
jgi:hypothetical protein